MNAAQTLALPRFGADPMPPVRIPQGRTIGSITGVAVTPDGHIWMLHIASNMAWGPAGQSDDPALRLGAVVEFDAAGNYLQDWGGPDHLPRENGLQQWPRQEETIAFDSEGTLWLFGADTSYDHAVQRFTRDGKLLLRIGRYGETGGNASKTLLGCPTDCWHDVARREVFITDGYVNHRVAVFNSDTGAFLRSFGAYGNLPDAGLPLPARFNNPVHAISIGPDGLMYICDRKNDRVQVFDAVGRAEAVFVREMEFRHPSPFGTVFNLAFTPDGKFMLVNDGTNSRLWIVDLAAWQCVGHVMAPDGVVGDINLTLHKFCTDASGNLLLARTSRGVERMLYTAPGA
jgi:DNA-binding beta-propeller fold protein YncE